MPSCGCTIRNLGGGNVSHWMYLQLLHFSSGALEENAFWSSRELVWYKVAPAPWVQVPPPKSKRSRGYSEKPAEGKQTQPKRPRGRPPKYVLAEVLAAARTAGSFTN